jgi:hypothetical protein
MWGWYFDAISAIRAILFRGWGSNQNCWVNAGCRIKSGMTVATLSVIPAKAGHAVKRSAIHIQIETQHF